MKVSWTQGLDEDAAKEVRGDFLSSRVTRHRLVKLLIDKINTNRTAAVSKDGYDTPNWPMKQADSIGFERALKEVMSLIED